MADENWVGSGFACPNGGPHAISQGNGKFLICKGTSRQKNGQSRVDHIGVFSTTMITIVGTIALSHIIIRSSRTQEQ